MKSNETANVNVFNITDSTQDEIERLQKLFEPRRYHLIKADGDILVYDSGKLIGYAQITDMGNGPAIDLRKLNTNLHGN